MKISGRRLKLLVAASTIVLIVSLIAGMFFRNRFGFNVSRGEKDAEQTTSLLSSSRESADISVKRPTRAPAQNLESRYLAMEEAISGSNYGSDSIQCEKLLRENLDAILKFPNPERDLLLSRLVVFYTTGVFSGSSPALFVEKMDLFRRVTHEPGKLSDPTRMDDEALSKSIYLIKKLDEKSVAAYSKSLEEMSDSGKYILAAPIFGGILVSGFDRDGVSDPSALSGIANPSVRREAERAFILDASQKSEETAAAFARYYFSPNSLIERDHRVEMKLFGDGVSGYPVAISKEIASASPGLKRDLAIEQMIYRIADSDMDSAKDWFSQIQDPAIKKRAEKDILGTRVK